MNFSFLFTLFAPLSFHLMFFVGVTFFFVEVFQK